MRLLNDVFRYSTSIRDTVISRGIEFTEFHFIVYAMHVFLFIECEVADDLELNININFQDLKFNDFKF